ncbi:hypothetical protein V4C53_44670 [Paraburkholderia azotifigens]
MAAEQSLRMAVGKWLGATHKHTVRVLAVRRSRSGQIVSVYVEAPGVGGPCALFFFHHAGHGWHVLPLDQARPTMSVERQAA